MKRRRRRLAHTPELDLIEHLAHESKALAEQITETVALLRREADTTGDDSDIDHA